MIIEGMGVMIDIKIESGDVAPILIAIGTLITTLTTTLGVIVSMVNSRKLNAVKSDVQTVKADVKVVHDNTNSAKDKAVIAAHDEGKLLGNVQGRIEQLIEDDEKRTKENSAQIERDRAKEYGS